VILTWVFRTSECPMPLTYVRGMYEDNSTRSSALIRNAAVTSFFVLCSPGAAQALSQSCSLLPGLADRAFGAAYTACVVAFLAIVILRLTGRLRPRSLLYPLWGAMLLLPLDLVSDYFWLNEIRGGQAHCYAP